jgi:uncharacterized protein (TIRG00374 family)
MQNETKRQVSLWNMLRIIIAIVLFYVVFSQTSLTEIIKVYKTLNFPWLIVYFGTFYGTLWLMTHRYYIFFREHIDFRETYKMVIWQTIVGNLLASSVAAIFYITELRGKFKIGVPMGIISLAIPRMFDFFGFLLCLCISGLMLWDEISELRPIIYFGFLLLIVLMITLLYLKPLIEFFIRHMNKFKNIKVGNFKLFINHIKEIKIFLEENHTEKFIKLLIFTIPIILFMFLFTYASFKIFFIDIPPWQILFVLMIQQIISIIPIQVMGGLGIYDVTDFYIYGLFGISPNILASILLSKRILFYFINFTLLIINSLDSFYKSKQK